MLKSSGSFFVLLQQQIDQAVCIILRVGANRDVIFNYVLPQTNMNPIIDVQSWSEHPSSLLQLVRLY